MSCLLCRPPHFQGTRLAVSRGLCVEEPSRGAIGQALGQGKDDRQGLQQMCLKAGCSKQCAVCCNAGSRGMQMTFLDSRRKARGELPSHLVIKPGTSLSCSGCQKHDRAQSVIRCESRPPRAAEHKGLDLSSSTANF